MPGPITQQITFLDATDLVRTADFYERILGLRLARDQGTCRVYHVCGSSYLGFCRRDTGSSPTDDPGSSPIAPRDAAGVTVLTLVTDDVDGWCAHLEAHGVEIVQPPADKPPYRIYNAFARDPDGYLVEIQRFWEPLA